MGLDVYAVRKGLDSSGYSHMEDSLFEGIKYPLCGGLFSSNGNGGSFRGKVYNDFIESISGVTLYQEMMSSDDIEKIVNNLRLVLSDCILRGVETVDSKYEVVTVDEIYSLLKWFIVVLKNNGNVVGWW